MKPVSEQDVVLLTNFIPPHQLPVMEALAARVGSLTVLLSTPLEEGRHFDVRWGTLDVVVQRTITLNRPRRHPLDLQDRVDIHLPLDTISQIRRRRPDAVISDEFGARSLLSAMACVTRQDTALVVGANLTPHTEQGRGRLRLALRKVLIRAATILTYNGNGAHKYLKDLGVGEDRLSHVPYVATPDAHYDGPTPRVDHDELRVLYVGELTPLKGIADFATELRELSASLTGGTVHFRVVGDGPSMEVMRSITDSDHFTIEVVGRKDYSELPSQYQWADVFAFPSLSDEWGLVVNEALASGLPVIGSSLSQAVNDLVVDGATGWTYSGDEPAERRAALERLLSSTAADRGGMRAECRTSVAHLTPEFAAHRHVEALEAAARRVHGR